jgi:hypothetical protein
MRCMTTQRIILIVAAGALLACGAHQVSGEKAPPAPGGQAAVEPEEEPVVEADGGTIEAPPFVYPVADCVPRQIWQEADDAMKVATSLEEFVALVGCEPSVAVDWSNEHVALLNFMGIGVMYYFQDVTMEDDIAVVKITEATLVGGAGVASRAQFFVRIPASAAGAKLVIESSRQEWNGPPQNPAFPSAPMAPPAGAPAPDAAPAAGDAVRETTIGALAEEPEVPGLVKVKAFFVKSLDPGPCPPKAQCEPCASLTVIADEPTPDVYKGLWVEGFPSKGKKLKKGKAYTFILRLEEGYKAELEDRTCDPRLLKISMEDCLDCTVKNKKTK